PKAQVSINGKSHGSTPLIIAKLQPGSYDISVSMPNFDVQNRKVEIIPGQKIVVDFELSQNTSGIDMIVNPPGVEIYMNGQKIGVSEKAETGPLSKLISLRGLNAGTYTLMFAHRLAQPPQVERKVELIKGEILRLKPINMWVANAELKLEGARPMIGLLYSQDENNVLFSPEPGVRVEYNRKDVEYLRIFDKELNQNDKNTNQ
ncbi:MAG: PEGA domain-containing protein, partial [Victivallaceae bacterium]|nr:PEGA domain-containing protein [Victivallaceae bacterium]